MHIAENTKIQTKNLGQFSALSTLFHYVALHEKRKQVVIAIYQIDTKHLGITE